MPNPTKVRNARGHEPTGRTAPASEPDPAVRGSPLSLLSANTSPCHPRAHATVVLAPAATHSSTPPATAARRTVSGGDRKPDSAQAMGRKCEQPYRPAHQSVHGARLHRSNQARVGARRRFGFPSRAVPHATGRGSAWRPADGWWRSMSRPNSSSPCRARNVHLLREGVLHHVRVQTLRGFVFSLFSFFPRPFRPSFDPTAGALALVRTASRSRS